MRLKSIKLVGFKSFVDPTTVPFPNNLSAIVGPNGCGKSNIVDAIRWVLGETSAKHLRGESMTDVIFNGSSARKPVGQASVELVFENNEGKLQGEYAKYAEIAVKRQVSRDGQSAYFLNSTKCRRKDIQDVFLGSGIGTRNSYSIIEQGMISRFIEAKPDDLRLFIEEAAGISKYKERRRETENRIRHTRENLERLEDVREEVAKQIEHLQRQAKAAEKYKVLKQDERLYKAQLLALHWLQMDHQIKNHDSVIKEKQVKVEERIAEQRGIDKEIELHRQQQTECGDTFNEVQAKYYAIGSEIARLEQSVTHHRERYQQLQSDQQQVEQAWQELTEHLSTDKQNISQWSQELLELEPALEQAKQATEASSDVLETAEQTMSQWQNQWDSFNQQAASVSQQVSVEKTRLQQLQQQQQRSMQRFTVVQSEHADINPNMLDQKIAELQHEQTNLQTVVEQQQQQLTDVRQQLTEQREQNQQTNDQLNVARSELQKMQGRQASLHALQQAASGSGSGSAGAWLENNSLQNNVRLAQQLNVKAGWEIAVETVLGAYLEAVCVDDVSQHTDFQQLQQGQVLLFDKANQNQQQHSDLAELLADYVSSDYPVAELLAGVHCAESLQDALQLREKLTDNQSVITQEGVWLGKSWLRVAKLADQQTSVIAREHELKQLTVKLDEQQQLVENLQANLGNGQNQLQQFEQQREQLQYQVNEQQQKLANVKASCSAQTNSREQLIKRAEQLQSEITETEQFLAECNVQIAQAEQTLQHAEAQMQRDTEQREQLASARGTYREALENAREKAKTDKERVHQLTLRIENIRTQLHSAEANIDRMQEQLQSVTQRRENLQQAMAEGESPVANLEQELQATLERRVIIDKDMQEARYKLETLNESLHNFEQRRNQVVEYVEALREDLQQAKLDFQTLDVRRTTYAEQIQAMNFEMQQLIAELPSEANLDEWEQELQRIANRIQRLGAINLAAIDEFKVQEERKVYLDAQYEDLTEALTTLETAIKKIDKETRERFQATFEQINAGFSELFPRVFGGGRAQLELTGDDILDTGVLVMAQPPGKRNSSIHLLSGGEKALTAISLVFAIFQLNPAPFCLLDEVDAPLDDSNVGRFCKLVKEMSEKVQFMFISHNKLAIEMADQLTGVTMHEPGVSRIVAVDVDQAVEMAVA
jgi:chromosome segregation protein